MDESVQAAMAKWPDVPALAGWLSLDEAGHWRLKGEPITHAGLIAFINRNYDHDEQGRWFFQNGPQRGYVELAYTPWVLHVDGGGELFRHTGDPVDQVDGAWLDEEGYLLLHTDAGIGLVDSDSLPAVAEWLVDGDGRGSDEIPSGPQSGTPPDLWLEFGGRRLPVDSIRRAEVPGRFGFAPAPRAD